MKLSKMCVVCLTMISIAGCTSTTAIDGCVVFETLEPSRRDTLETKRQILTHNETWERECQ